MNYAPTSLFPSVAKPNRLPALQLELRLNLPKPTPAPRTLTKYEALLAEVAVLKAQLKQGMDLLSLYDPAWDGSPQTGRQLASAMGCTPQNIGNIERRAKRKLGQVEVLVQVAHECDLKRLQAGPYPH